MSVLAVVPARAGSKRLPGKNLAAINDTPLTGWAIMAGHDAGICPVVVSTEDEAIATAAFHHGADAIVRRPAEFAADDAPMFDVIAHALDVMGWHDQVVLLQPTSPFRTAADIKACLDKCRFGPVVTVGPDGRTLNGAVYVCPTAYYLERKTFLTDDTVFHRMPAERSIDIDTQADLTRARDAVNVHALMGG